MTGFQRVILKKLRMLFAPMEKALHGTFASKISSLMTRNRRRTYAATRFSLPSDLARFKDLLRKLGRTSIGCTKKTGKDQFTTQSGIASPDEDGFGKGTGRMGQIFEQVPKFDKGNNRGKLEAKRRRDIRQGGNLRASSGQKSTLSRISRISTTCKKGRAAC